jgi:hypothetical protein
MDSLVTYGPPLPPQTPPAAPTGLTARAASGIQVNLTWVDRAGNEDGFLIEQSRDGIAFTQIAGLGVNANAVSVNNLQVGGFYYYRLRAYNMFGDKLTYSPYSNVAAVATEAQPPTLDFSTGFNSSGTLVNLVAGAQLTQAGAVQLTDGTADQVRALWTKTLRNAIRFSSEFTFRANGSAEGFTFCVQRLSPTALGAGGAGLGYGGLRRSVALKFDLAPSLSTTGLYTAGAAPGETAQAIDLTPSGIDLHSGHLIRVILTYNRNLLTETIIDTETDAAFSTQYRVNIPAIIGDAVAYFGFTAAAGIGGAAQEIDSWTYAPIPAAPPPAPPVLVVRAASGTQLNLTWRDPSNNEAGFIIQRRILPEMRFGTIAVVGPNMTSYMDTALSSEHVYDYVVRATNAAGYSLPSPLVRARPPIAPITPAGAKATIVTAHRVTLTWIDKATNESNYAILRKVGQDGEFRFLNANLPANSRTFTDLDIQPGTTYDYHIQCRNVAGYSDFAGMMVTTPAQ